MSKGPSGAGVDMATYTSLGMFLCYLPGPLSAPLHQRTGQQQWQQLSVPVQVTVSHHSLLGTTICKCGAQLSASTGALEALT